MKIVLFAAALVSILCGCAPDQPKADAGRVPRIDGVRAMALVNAICAYEQRYDGGVHCDSFWSFLANAVAQTGADVQRDAFEDVTPLGIRRFCNFYTEIPGKDTSEFIILGTHFDTKRGIEKFCGANDGASSTAVVLEMVRVMLKKTPPVTIRVCFFDGEECINEYGKDDGLHGSSRYARNLLLSDALKICRSVIILDMVGDRDLTITLSASTPPKMRHAAERAAERLGRPDLFVDYHHSIIDDHTPFERLNIPTLDLIDFLYGPNNCYWHTSQDAPDKLSAESLELSGNLALEILYETDPKE